MTFLKTIYNYLKTHWVTVVAIGMVLWSVDKPYVTAFVQAHPFASIIYANIAAVVSFYIKSPLFSAAPKS